MYSLGQRGQFTDGKTKLIKNCYRNFAATFEVRGVFLWINTQNMFLYWKICSLWLNNRLIIDPIYAFTWSIIINPMVWTDCWKLMCRQNTKIPSVIRRTKWWFFIFFNTTHSNVFSYNIDPLTQFSIKFFKRNVWLRLQLKNSKLVWYYASHEHCVSMSIINKNDWNKRKWSFCADQQFTNPCI